jgi:hypothetical protein
MSVSPAELRAALLPLLPLCATVHQLNANLLFELSDLPTEGWLRSVELLLRGDGQTARVGHGDQVA